MTGGHEHTGQYRNGASAARRAALDGVGDNGSSELKKTVLDDALRVRGAEQLDEATKFPRTFWITAAVPDKQYG
jgi:hypothetical protein